MTVSPLTAHQAVVSRALRRAHAVTRVRQDAQSTRSCAAQGQPKPKRHDTPIKPGQLLLFKPQVIDLLGGLSYSTLW